MVANEPTIPTIPMTLMTPTMLARPMTYNNTDNDTDDDTDNDTNDDTDDDTNDTDGADGIES
jgi:hypothetical protein